MAKVCRQAHHRVEVCQERHGALILLPGAGWRDLSRCHIRRQARTDQPQIHEMCRENWQYICGCTAKKEISCPNSRARKKTRGQGCWTALLARLFGSPSTLSDGRFRCHVRRHTKFPPYSCDECEHLEQSRRWAAIDERQRWGRLPAKLWAEGYDEGKVMELREVGPRGGARDPAPAPLGHRINQHLRPLPPPVHVPLDARWGHEFYHYPPHIARQFPPAPPPSRPLPPVPQRPGRRNHGAGGDRAREVRVAHRVDPQLLAYPRRLTWYQPREQPAEEPAAAALWKGKTAGSGAKAGSKADKPKMPKMPKMPKTSKKLTKQQASASGSSKRGHQPRETRTAKRTEQTKRASSTQAIQASGASSMRILRTKGARSPRVVKAAFKPAYPSRFREHLLQAVVPLDGGSDISWACRDARQIERG